MIYQNGKMKKRKPFHRDKEKKENEKLFNF